MSSIEHRIAMAEFCKLVESPVVSSKTKKCLVWTDNETCPEENSKKRLLSTHSESPKPANRRKSIWPVGGSTDCEVADSALGQVSSSPKPTNRRKSIWPVGGSTEPEVADQMTSSPKPANRRKSIWPVGGSTEPDVADSALELQVSSPPPSVKMARKSILVSGKHREVKDDHRPSELRCKVLAKEAKPQGILSTGSPKWRRKSVWMSEPEENEQVDSDSDYNVLNSAKRKGIMDAGKKKRKVLVKAKSVSIDVPQLEGSQTGTRQRSSSDVLPVTTANTGGGYTRRKSTWAFGVGEETDEEEDENGKDDAKIALLSKEVEIDAHRNVIEHEMDILHHQVETSSCVCNDTDTFNSTVPMKTKKDSLKVENVLLECEDAVGSSSLRKASTCSAQLRKESMWSYKQRRKVQGGEGGKRRESAVVKCWRCCMAKPAPDSDPDDPDDPRRRSTVVTVTIQRAYADSLLPLPT